MISLDLAHSNYLQFLLFSQKGFAQGVKAGTWAGWGGDPAHVRAVALPMVALIKNKVLLDLKTTLNDILKKKS